MPLYVSNETTALSNLVHTTKSPAIVKTFHPNNLSDKFQLMSSGNVPELMASWLTKGAYHLLQLAGPQELVLIVVNGKLKAGPRNYSRDPCVGYTQELM